MKYIAPVVIVLLALLAANTVYVVGEGQAAVLTRLGQVEAAGVGPGVHLKPPLWVSVQVYDTREIVSQVAAEEVRTRDGEPLRVALLLRWQIVDPVAYFKATAADEPQATRQMETALLDVLRQRIAKLPVATVLTANGSGFGAQLRDAARADIRQTLGIDLLAVGIGRVLPPDDTLAAVYQRMQAEAKARAGEIRADGEATAATLRAKADADDQQLLAAAARDAAVTQGQAEARAVKVYAAASARNPGFFQYWSSLETWRDSLGGGAVVVLDKDSPLMRAIEAGASPADATRH